MLLWPKVPGNKSRLALYTGYESTGKSGEELVPEPIFGEHDIFNIQAFTFGAGAWFVWDNEYIGLQSYL